MIPNCDIAYEKDVARARCGLYGYRISLELDNDQGDTNIVDITPVHINAWYSFKGNTTSLTQALNKLVACRTALGADPLLYQYGVKPSDNTEVTAVTFILEHLSHLAVCSEDCDSLNTVGALKTLASGNFSEIGILQCKYHYYMNGLRLRRPLDIGAEKSLARRGVSLPLAMLLELEPRHIRAYYQLCFDSAGAARVSLTNAVAGMWDNAPSFNFAGDYADMWRFVLYCLEHPDQEFAHMLTCAAVTSLIECARGYPIHRARFERVYGGYLQTVMGLKKIS